MASTRIPSGTEMALRSDGFSFRRRLGMGQTLYLRPFRTISIVPTNHSHRV